MEIPLENPWKWHFRDSKFQNVARCLSPKKLVPLVLVRHTKEKNTLSLTPTFESLTLS